jgi:hypothetical protein
MLDDLTTARAAADELAEIAQDHRTPALRATADAGRAGVLLAQGALGDAERAARDAQAVFTEIDLIYEAARMSEVLGRICLARGEPDRARAEHRAALDTFERIGAVLDARRSRAVLAELEATAAPGPGSA